MKIAVLAPLEHPIREPYAGGLEKHTAQLALGLAGLGHEVDLYARPESQLPAGVSLIAVSASYGDALRLIRHGDYDVAHNNTINYLPLLGAWRLPFPVVTTLHTPPYKRLALGALASRMTGGSSFVAISRALALRWVRFTGSAHIIHNGIEPENWPFSASPEPSTAIWCGRLSPEKGAEYAIAAAKRAGYRLRLAGSIYDRDYFDREVVPLLGEGIEYVGHLDQPAVGKLIAAAEVALFTSVWEEPFGLVLTEYLACGTPVAGFDSGAAPEIVTRGVGRLVAKRDVDALADAMLQCRTIDRTGCRDYVSDNFPVQAMTKSYEDVYRRLLKNATRA